MSSFSWKLPGEDTTRYSHQEKKISWTERNTILTHCNLTGRTFTLLTSNLVVCQSLSCQYQMPPKHLEKCFSSCPLSAPAITSFLLFQKEEIAGVQEWVDNQNRARIYPCSFVLEKVFESLGGWNAEAWDVIDVVISVQICPSYESVCISAGIKRGDEHKGPKISGKQKVNNCV